MTLPIPEEGLVIRCSYLWHAEYREGREEGVRIALAPLSWRLKPGTLSERNKEAWLHRCTHFLSMGME